MRLKYASTYHDRMALIREVHQAFLRKESAGQDPDLYYTDASKYADEYYGDTYRETVKYDNDWD